MHRVTAACQRGYLHHSRGTIPPIIAAAIMKAERCRCCCWCCCRHCVYKQQAHHRHLHGSGPLPRQISCPHIGPQRLSMPEPQITKPQLPTATPDVAEHAWLAPGSRTAETCCCMKQHRPTPSALRPPESPVCLNTVCILDIGFSLPLPDPVRYPPDYSTHLAVLCSRQLVPLCANL